MNNSFNANVSFHSLNMPSKKALEKRVGTYFANEADKARACLEELSKDTIVRVKPKGKAHEHFAWFNVSVRKKPKNIFQALLGKEEKNSCYGDTVRFVDKEKLYKGKEPPEDNSKILIDCVKEMLGYLNA